MKVTFDANILVYAYSDQGGEKSEHAANCCGGL